MFSPEGGGTIGQVSCADALKFKSLDSYPEAKSQIGTAWIWSYENEVTLYINGWDSQYNKVHPKASPPNILFTYPTNTILETHPECKSPYIYLTYTPTSIPDALCAKQNLTTEECSNVGEHQYDIAKTYEVPGVCEGGRFPYYGVKTKVTFENNTVTIARKEWGTEKGERIETNIYFSSYKTSRMNTETYFKFSTEGIVIEKKSNDTLCFVEIMTRVK